MLDRGLTVIVCVLARGIRPSLTRCFAINQDVDVDIDADRRPRMPSIL